MWPFLPLDPTRLPVPPPPAVPTLTYGPFLLALVVVTALPFALAAAYHRGRAPRAALYGLLALASALLLNVLWHVGWSLALGRYTPGLVTALVVLFPVVTSVLWRASREGWLQKRALWSLPVSAVLLHGPGLLGLLAGARWALADRG